MPNTKYSPPILIIFPFHPQGTLRPIFESQLKQKRLVRNRAISLRRKLAEAGLDYGALEAAVKDSSLRKTLEATGAVGEDVEEIVKLIEDHFSLGETLDASRTILFDFFPLRQHPFSEACPRGVRQYPLRKLPFSEARHCGVRQFSLRKLACREDCDRGVRPVFLTLMAMAAGRKFL